MQRLRNLLVLGVACLLLTQTSCGDTTPPPGEVDPCLARRQVDFGTSYNSHLDSSDCHLDNGTYGEYFRTTATGSFTVSLTSSTFDPRLFVYSPDQTIIAENDDANPNTQGSSLRIIGGSSPATYVFTASSGQQNQSGDFTLATEQNSTSLTDCKLAWLVRGASASQKLETTDCTGVSFYDRYSIYLKSGETVTIRMMSTMFESSVEVFGVTGHKVAGAVGGADINYTPGDTGYYLVYAASTGPNQTGSYVLTIN
ncbi:MAG TPA: hypothetical protein VJ840_17830 [Gemmatimonadaceae bacterium]|nr:hypothetical protein [Gemmatimonadaceae bacterium]